MSNNNYHPVTSSEHPNNNHLHLSVRRYHPSLRNYNDCLGIYHHNFQMIYFVLIQIFYKRNYHRVGKKKVQFQ